MCGGRGGVFNKTMLVIYTKMEKEKHTAALFIPLLAPSLPQLYTPAHISRVCVLGVVGPFLGIWGAQKKQKMSDAIRFAILSYQLLSGQSFLTGEKLLSGKNCVLHTHTHTPKKPRSRPGGLELTHTEQVIGSLVELEGSRKKGKNSHQVYPPF